MHALYENGFGSDFVDAVYTTVFGGDTESAKIVQADIVTIFQPIYNISSISIHERASSERREDEPCDISSNIRSLFIVPRLTTLG